MKITLIATLIITVLVAIVLYAFQAIKSITKNQLAHISYGVLCLVVLLYFISIIIRYDHSVGPDKESMIFSTILSLLLVPKLVIILFMFGEDVSRFLQECIVTLHTIHQVNLQMILYRQDVDLLVNWP